MEDIWLHIVSPATLWLAAARVGGIFMVAPVFGERVVPIRLRVFMSLVIGLAVVANEGGFVNKQLDTVINFINGDGRFYVGQIQREIFSQND